MVDSLITIPLPVATPRSSTSAKAQSRSLAVDSFLAGPENGLVRIVVEELLRPSPHFFAYNPVVFYGPPGAGKTHLAEGLAQAWEQSRSEKGAALLTGEKWPRRKDQLRATMSRVARASMFVLDDLHVLAKNPSALQHLRFVLDDLIAAGHRCVVTSRVPPSSIAQLPVAVRSRLSMGLVVPLAFPTKQTKMAIVDRYLSTRVSQQVASSLAEQSRSTGQLLGNLEAIARQASPTDSIEAAKIADIVAHHATPTIRKVTAIVARYFDLKVGDLKGRSRRQAVARARCIAMYVSRKQCQSSLGRVGKYLGGRDHTTVLHGCRKVEELLARDLAVQQIIADLNRLVEQSLSENR